MEKRLILAIALSAAVLFLWTKMFPPPKPPPKQNDPAIVDTRSTETEPLPATPQPGELSETGQLEGVPAVAAVAIEDVKFENDLFRIVFTNKGGRAVSWNLLDYGTNGDRDKGLEVIPRFTERDALPLGISLDDTSLTAAINNALFEVKRTQVDGNGERIGFHWADGRGLEVRKAFTFYPGEYLVDVDLEVVDRGRRLPARLAVGPGFGAQEVRKGRSNYYYASQAVWNLGGEVDRRKRKKLEGQGGLAGPLLWAGLEDQFFTALILPGSERSELHWETLSRTAVPLPGAEAPDEAPEAVDEPLLSVALPDGTGQLYVGPKQYKLLKKQGSELEKSVWFSSQAWLAAIVKFIYLGLLWIHDHVVANYGVAIILATTTLRLALFPLNQYAMVNMKKSQLDMQRLQPKMKAIKNKFKKQKDAQSRAKMNQEIMEMYKREGVNPAGSVTGCLPLLAQFPILIGFYNMLTVAVELRGAPFMLWITDLSVKDDFYITPLLMGVTMFVQQRMAMSKIKDPQQLQQQKIMMFMPVMFTFICLQMPAGLVLYWFVNNLLAMGQQYLVNRQTGRLEAPPKKA